MGQGDLISRALPLRPHVPSRHAQAKLTLDYTLEYCITNILGAGVA